MLDKLKSLSKDTLIYGTNTIIGRFLNFLFVPLYTNIFAPGEYGVVANIYAYIAILNVFFTIGLESGYFKFASTLEVGDEKENFTTPFLGIFINSLGLALLLIIFANNLTGVFQINENKAYLLQYTAGILFFDAISIVPFAYLRLKHKPVLFSVLKVINISINVILNFILILGLRWGIESVFISNLVASVVTFILLLPIIIKELKITFNKKLINELMKFSLPYIPAGITSNIVQVINRPMLYAMTNDSVVGIFQANYRLGIFMMLFVSMFEFAWRPFFLQTVQEDPVNAKKIFSKVMTLFLIAASLIFLVLSLFITDIAQIKLMGRGHLIGSKYWSGLNIVPIILFAYLLYGLYINLMAGIYIEKKTKYLPLITGAAAVINVGLNLLLIPPFGMMGAAVVTLVSYFSMLAGIYMVTRKYYPVKYEYKKIFLTFMSLFITYGIYLIAQQISVLNHWYIKIFIIIIFVLSIFAMKVINLKSLRTVISS
jgi:O-antigen/teichoic acid export membrane protein